MALDAFGLVRTLHVAAAGTLLGATLVLPLLRPRLEGHEDSRFTAGGLAHVATVERWILAPAAAGLLGAGLLLVEGPLARFSFTAPDAGWLHLGATLWLVLAAGLAIMFHARRRLQREADRGTTGGSRVRALWRRWTAGAAAVVLSAAAGIAAMAMKLGA